MPHAACRSERGIAVAARLFIYKGMLHVVIAIMHHADADYWRLGCASSCHAGACFVVVYGSAPSASAVALVIGVFSVVLCCLG